MYKILRVLLVLLIVFGLTGLLFRALDGLAISAAAAPLDFDLQSPQLDASSKIEVSSTQPITYYEPGDSLVESNGNYYLYRNQTITDSSASRYEMYRFSTQTERWTRLSTANTHIRPPGRRSQAGAGSQGSIYILGGRNPVTGAILNDIWRFDPNTNTWYLVPQDTIPSGWAGHTAVGYNNKIMIFGGTMSTVTQPAKVWRFDTSTGYWSTSALNCPAGTLRGHSAGMLGAYMYIVGGENPAAGGNQAQTAAVILLQRTDGNQFLPVTVNSIEQPSARKYQAAAFDSNSNTIYVFGGQEIATGAIMSDTWKFEANTGIWTRLGDLPKPMAGGNAGVWLPAPRDRSSLPTGRLANGVKVILVGGKDASGMDLDESYIYDGITYQAQTLPISYTLMLPLVAKQP